MDKTIELPNVRPGVLSAFLFIFLDVFIIAVLDNFMSKVVCLVYYRNIDRGRRIHVKSTDIPGFSHYLLGRPFSFINIISVIIKLSMFAIILATNISIRGKAARTWSDSRYATFGLDPSDEYIKRKKLSPVPRRFESSKSCFELQGKRVTYYSVRFNLNGDEELGSEFEENNSKKTSYTINDSSIMCMSPTKVSKPEPLAVVRDCTRTNKSQGCLTVISRRTQKDASNITFITPEPLDGEVLHDFLDADPEQVKKTFWEYESPSLTCLVTTIGIDSSDSSHSSLDHKHCLLVAYNETIKTNVTTIVERWVFSSRLENSGEKKDIFISEYPGIIFEGRLNFGRLASERYLKTPFPFTDYITLSGELISQASTYEYLNKSSSQRFGRLERGENLVVTAVELYAIPLVVSATVIVLVSFLVMLLVERTDRRPRFNTINGLSSIMREENSPTGRSYVGGKFAILGLKFTRSDKMHFGPIEDGTDVVEFRDGQDLS